MLGTFRVGIVGVRERDPQTRTILRRRTELRDAQTQLGRHFNSPCHTFACNNAASSNSDQSVAVNDTDNGDAPHNFHHVRVLAGHADPSGIRTGNRGCTAALTSITVSDDERCPARRQAGLGGNPCLPLRGSLFQILASTVNGQ
jgi:hypothetical protein